MRLVRLLAALALLLVLPPAAGATPLAPAPLGGGSLLFNQSSAARCMAGFAATDSRSGYLIASANCGSVGTPLFSGSNIVVGPVVSAPFPPGGHAIVQVRNTTDWVLVPWIDTPPGRVVIRGSRETPIGGSVCLLGRTSGWHCGIVTAKNQTVTFPGGALTGLTRTTVCAEPGDSGAPFLTGDQAQGVLVGGSGNCSSGGISFFAPVNPILAATGLRLLTG